MTLFSPGNRLTSKIDAPIAWKNPQNRHYSLEVQTHRSLNYDRYPFIAVRGATDDCVTGWDAIAHRIHASISDVNRKIIITLECYPGVNEDEVFTELIARLKSAHGFRVSEILRSTDEIEKLVEPFLGGSDPVFGYLSGLTLPQFFDPDLVAKQQCAINAIEEGIILVVGCGARLIVNETEEHLLIYADLARREARLRFRRGESANLGAQNRGASPALQSKRAFFVDWRVCDQWKRPLIAKWDFVLDTHDARMPKLATGDAVRRGFEQAVSRPFRVMPFFDPAPWGGQWMQQVCDLDPGVPNFGRCFDCVPEENSLLLGFGPERFETPSINLVFAQPQALLGEKVYARFGAEFPIRFNFLDTIGGGNLSFQIHPLTSYIQQHFGMHYTQDESYYILDASSTASVYLGLREDCDPGAMLAALEAAQNGGAPFEADGFACHWRAEKHDHFLIPAGTVHCAGKGTMVLEISSAPYIFTFKLWDWGHPGLDGRPRPIHLEHGKANIQWDRRENWVRQNLINRMAPLVSGDGWREQHTGLHETQFIETRRHWFIKPVLHHTDGGVNVLNLVEGREAVVESPDRAFEPFTVHYAETFIIPAEVGAYRIRPADEAPPEPLGTIKAFVRV